MKQPFIDTYRPLEQIWRLYVARDIQETFPAWPSSERGKTPEECAKWDRLNRVLKQAKKDRLAYDLWKSDIKREIDYMERQERRYHLNWIH